MYHNQFIKVASVTPKLKVANPEYNVREMLRLLKDVHSSITVFPELGVTAYTCNDLFFQNSLLNDTKEAIRHLLENNPYDGILVFGAPFQIDGILYNSAFVAKGKELLGIIPKFYLPNTQEFYEKRWFTSAFDIVKTTKMVRFLGQVVPFGSIIFREENTHLSFGIEICEDMWAPISPGNMLALQGAQLILNLSASNEYLDKRATRKRTIIEHSRRNAGGYVYCSAGVNESTSETVFSGHNVIAQNGDLLVETEHFSRESEIIYGDIDISKIAYVRKANSSFRDSLNRHPFPTVEVDFSLDETDTYTFEKRFDKTPFVPKEKVDEAFEKIAALQENALIKRIKHVGSKTIVIGISGGLDSTLALLIATRVMDSFERSRKNILAVTMPALATSDRTRSQAHALAENLGVTLKEIPLNDHVSDHLDIIGHDGKTLDKAYENAQARARTMVLMNLANMHQGLVLGTGDMSEIALGWCTYNGDQMSMYNINAGLPKTLVRFMIANYADRKFGDAVVDTIEDVLDTPISPELLLGQETEETIGSYEVNDFILHRFLRFGDDEPRIEWLIEKTFDMEKDEANHYVRQFFKRFYSQQFKRQASPDAPKILDISLSPRADFRMPSDVDKSQEE
ncbi:MAG: NAD(+) synthase [Bacillota bacterium]